MVSPHGVHAADWSGIGTQHERLQTGNSGFCDSMLDC